MGRSIRFIPPGGSLVEVTCRTVQGRFLLRPSRELNEIIVGILARACRRYSVDLSAAVFLSNHFHLLVWVEDASRLARFMNYVNGNLAREAGRLHAWNGPFWAHRYHSVVVSNEEQAQAQRLRYVLAHGAKEGLVARPIDWPGVHCAKALSNGSPLRGFWFDRTQESEARRKGQSLKRYDHAQKEVLEFAKLPCWSHLDDETYRQRIEDVLRQINLETAAEHGGDRRTNKARIKAVLGQDPHNSPPRLARRPVPRFHASHRQVRNQLHQTYSVIIGIYREAARRLRAGEVGVTFPPGCFPPPQPFVPAPMKRSP